MLNCNPVLSLRQKIFILQLKLLLHYDSYVITLQNYDGKKFHPISGDTLNEEAAEIGKCDLQSFFFS